MLKLSEIYNELITEAVDRNSLIKAIQDKKLISIYYDSPHGDQPDGKGWRRIEPFCYGINHYDNSVLRAWQVHGPSDSYPEGKPKDPLTHVPGWRMFRIDGIKSINETGNDRFTQPRPKYNPDDKDMKIIYASAKFDNTDTQQQAAPEQPVTGTPSSPVSTSSPVASTPTISSFPSAFSSTQKTAQDYGDEDGVTDVDNPLNPNINQEVEPEPANKPSWFTKFGDKFKNIVNFGKKDKDKI